MKVQGQVSSHSGRSIVGYRARCSLTIWKTGGREIETCFRPAARRRSGTSVFTPFLIKEALFVLPIGRAAKPQILREFLNLCDPLRHVAWWISREIGVFVRFPLHNPS